MKLEYGNIEPGKRIGNYYLGTPIEEIKRMLIGEFSILDEKNGLVKGWKRIDLENFSLWFENGFLNQVEVYEGFKDKFENNIGIGNTLTDIAQKYGGFYYEDYNWYIKGIEGIRFDLEDCDDEKEWNELKAPISAIFVYKSLLT